MESCTDTYGILQQIDGGGDFLTRENAIAFLRNRPTEYAHLLGLTKLGDIHNDWIRDMVIGRGDRTLQASRG